MNFEKPYPRENEYRGYSASPTKMRRYEDPAIENYEESHYRNRQYCNYSPSRKADHYESPNKKRDYNYLGRVELSESPSKKYHPLESESRVKNLGCLDQNKFHYEYNPEKSKVENYLPRGRTYSDIKTDDKNTL